MKSLIAFFASLLVLAPPSGLNAQTHFAVSAGAETSAVGKNLNGWGAATWGMKRKAILDAFHGSALRLTQPEKYFGEAVGDIEIPEVEIGVVKARVVFIFPSGDESASVQQINMISKNATSTAPLDFEVLETLLTQKYGPPTTQRGSAVYDMRETTWVFPKTTIEVSLHRISLWQTLIVYRPTRSEPNL